MERAKRFEFLNFTTKIKITWSSNQCNLYPMHISILIIRAKKKNAMLRSIEEQRRIHFHTKNASDSQSLSSSPFSICLILNMLLSKHILMDVIYCNFVQNCKPSIYYWLQEDRWILHEQKVRVPICTMIFMWAYINTHAHKSCPNNGYLMTGSQHNI